MPVPFQHLTNDQDNLTNGCSDHCTNSWSMKNVLLSSLMATMTNNLTAMDAVKEMSLMTAKTPVSLLQEVLSKRGTTPKYELVQIEGAIHEPTFRYRVTVGNVVAFGTGRSKKVAKHTAAKNVLEKLVGKINGEEKKTTPSNAVLPYNPVNNSFDKISGNPIGTLQEMCISRRWPPPVYEMTCEEGLPHERQFTITCIIFEYKEVGSGKSKKLAKRQAAYKMWEKLRECPPDPSQTDGVDEGGQDCNSQVCRYTELRSNKAANLKTPHCVKVSTFHKNLKQSTGVKLNELQVVPFYSSEFDPVQFLEEISIEQRFKVTYMDIDELSISGQHQCLVQLSTIPVAVCHGSGTTMDNAKFRAALNALEYLKIVSKS